MFNFQIIDLAAWIRTLLYTLITAVSSRLDRSLVRTFKIHFFLALLAPDFFKIHLLFAVHLFLYLQLSWLLARSILHYVDVLIFVLGSGMFTVIFAAYLGIVAGWASIFVLRLLRAATRPGQVTAFDQPARRYFLWRVVDLKLFFHKSTHSVHILLFSLEMLVLMQRFLLVNIVAIAIAIGLLVVQALLPPRYHQLCFLRVGSSRDILTILDAREDRMFWLSL